VDDIDSSGLQAEQDEKKGPKGGPKWNKHTEPRAGGPEKADKRRPIKGTRKAGAKGSMKPVNPNVGNQGSDRGKRNEDPPPMLEPGVNPIYVLPVAALPRVAPAIPRLAPSVGRWFGDAGRWLGGVGRGMVEVGGGLASPIFIMITPKGVIPGKEIPEG
jgi:hypothetical protein